MAPNSEYTSGIRRAIVKIATPSAPRGIAVGWAYVCNDEQGRQVLDYSDEFAEFKEIEEAFEEAFAPGSGEVNSGVLHLADGGARIIGQITLDKLEREALGFGAGHEGALIKVRILDPDLLEMVRSGELPAFSVEIDADCQEMIGEVIDVEGEE